MNNSAKVQQILEQLKSYAEHCQFCTFEASPSDSQSILMYLNGKFVRGVADLNRDSAEPLFCERQEIRLSIPNEFPEAPPEIFWKSEIFHPNIPLGGALSLNDVGLVWDAQMTMPVVCERIWDVARLAYLEPDDPANSSAGNWFSNKFSIELPLDQRRFEKPKSHLLTNIFSYQRKHSAGKSNSATSSSNRPSGASRTGPVGSDQDIIFID